MKKWLVVLIIAASLLIFGCPGNGAEPTPTPGPSATPDATPFIEPAPSPTPPGVQELSRKWNPVLQLEHDSIVYSDDGKTPTGNSMVFSITHSLAPNESAYRTIPVDAGIQMLQIAIFSEKRLEISVASPSGSSSQNILSPGERYGMARDFFSFGSPSHGEWAIQVRNNNTDMQSFLIIASGQSRVAHISEANSEYYLGEPVCISQFIMGENLPTSGRNEFWALLFDSAGSSKDIRLQDNGEYGDYEKGDGVFTGCVTDDLAPGRYTLHFYASVSGGGPSPAEAGAISITWLRREAVKQITVLNEKSPTEKSLSISGGSVSALPGQTAVLQVRMTPSTSGYAQVGHTGLSCPASLIPADRISVGQRFIEFSPSKENAITVSVRVPAGALPCNYSGYLLLTSNQSVKIPISVDVSGSFILDQSNATLGIGESFQLTESLSVRLVAIHESTANVSGEIMAVRKAEMGLYSGLGHIFSLNGSNGSTLIFRNPGTGDPMFSVLIMETRESNADLVIKKYASLGPTATPAPSQPAPLVKLVAGVPHQLNEYNSIQLISASGGVAEVGYYSQGNLVYSRRGSAGQTLEFVVPGSGELALTVSLQAVRNGEADVVVTQY